MTYRMIISLLVLTTILCSCKKVPNLSGTKWVAKSITLPDGKTLSAQKDYPLELKDAGQVSLQLDVNQCFARYGTPEAGRIIFEPAACTKACCDSEFGTRLVALLPAIQHFEMKGKQLILTGTAPTQIILESSL